MPRQAYTAKTIALPVARVQDPMMQHAINSLVKGVQNQFSRYTSEVPNPIPFIYIGANAVSPLTVPAGLVAIYISAVPPQNGDFIVNLPAASGSGALIGVQKAGAAVHNVVVNPAGNDTINQRVVNPTLFQTNQAIILVDLETGDWGIFGSFNPPGALFAQTSSITIANTATETTILGAGAGSLILPANFLDMGVTLHVDAWGFFSAAASATFEYRFYVGSILLLDTGQSILANSQLSGTWHLTLALACQTKGSSGTIIAQGGIQYGLPASMSGGGYESFLPLITPATIDTTQPQTLNLTFQWGTANPLSSLTVTNVSVNY